jgi:hypothetical protein
MPGFLAIILSHRVENKLENQVQENPFYGEEYDCYD